MRILVTGAGGFIGGLLSRRLAERGDAALLACSRSLPPGMAGARLDLLDTPALRRTLADFAPEVVLHAAGRTSGAASLMLRDNAVATAALCEAMAAETPQAGLLILGSAAQYGPSADRQPWRESDPCQPQDPYAISKHAAERCAMPWTGEGRPKVTALRLFNLVSADPGGGQVFANFLEKAVQAAAGPPPRLVRMGPLDAIRDFVDIEAVWRVAAAVIERGVWGEVINVASGEGRSARDVIEATLLLAGGVVALEEPPASQGGGLAWSVGDPAKCEALLGFAPSGDLRPVLGRAAARIAAAAEAGDAGGDARSRA